MSLFRIQWLRRLVRRNTKPIPTDKAASWKGKLSVAYALVAWNGFGLVCYMIYTGKADWAKFYGLKSEEELNMSPGQQWAKTLGIKKATIYRVSGLNVSHEEFDDTVNEENKQIISTHKK